MLMRSITDEFKNDEINNADEVLQLNYEFEFRRDYYWALKYLLQREELWSKDQQVCWFISSIFEDCSDANLFIDLQYHFIY